MTAVTSYAAREIILPNVLRRAGVDDPLRQHGPVKVFLRRTSASNGRNLINQDEIQSWFTARGYLAVDPGTMTMDEQVLLHARATHIAGAEGAAFTNLLFAVNAREVMMIGSPVTAGEKFFTNIARHAGFAFHRIYGETGASAGGERNADFTLPLDKLAAAAAAMTS